ncbi:DUF917 domain-containing protein [Vibrio intestinalis]|uniref:DUF917 domain-containing protein n=1 Tax=Vibrio intestinalis TaxID=2933291 RepID=UPI0021A30991|nr:DUF917 domain-containing protein [Vibrio intestinalis]
METLKIEHLFEIANGSTLLASGGGGSIKTAYGFIAKIAQEQQQGNPVKLAKLDDLNTNDYGAVVAAMGSPKSFERIGLKGAETRAFSTLEKNVQQQNIADKLSYTISVETGSNIFVAMLAALKHTPAIQLVDADGAGRSVPTLSSLTFTQEVPATPFVLRPAHENVPGAQFANGLTLNLTSDSNPVEQAQITEFTIRPMLANPDSFDGIGAIAGWPMSVQQAKSALVPNTISLSRDIGHSLATSGDNQPLAALRHYLAMQHDITLTPLFDNDLPCIVDKVSAKSEGGFDFTELRFKQTKEILNDHNAKEQEMVVLNQNENLIAWNTSQPAPIDMCPNLICMIGKIDAELIEEIIAPLTEEDKQLAYPHLNSLHGLSVEDVKEKQQVYLFSLPPHAKLKTEQAVQNFNSMLQSFGYFGTNTCV